jgi:hypothetical protein
MGNLLLPQGDFAALAELPAMYHHCKTTEDPDLNVVDFVIEHLLNITENDNTDEHELPHNPAPSHTVNPSFVYCITEPLRFLFETVQQAANCEPNYQNPYFSRTGLHRIFQPPRA